MLRSALGHYRDQFIVRKCATGGVPMSGGYNTHGNANQKHRGTVRYATCLHRTTVAPENVPGKSSSMASTVRTLYSIRFWKGTARRGANTLFCLFTSRERSKTHTDRATGRNSPCYTHRSPCRVLASKAVIIQHYSARMLR